LSSNAWLNKETAMKRQLWVFALPVLLAACGPAPSSPPASPPPPAQPAPPPASSLPPVEPIAPGQPGGLPDDRTPLPEGPIDPKSAQGAAQVVQSYYALIGERKYGEAWKLWSDGGSASGMTAEQFAASFAAFSQYDAQIGGPGQMEGAAGSSYVEVPVQVYGRTATGAAFHKLGTVTLRRVNDVPGSTDEQRQWRIYRIDLP
jgi:hypothetical protein